MKKNLCVLPILSLLILAACGGGANIPNTAVLTVEPVPAEFAGITNPLGTDAAAAGEEVFMSSCKSCHGPEGHGDGPAAASLDPRPRNLVELQKQVRDDYLFWRISTGRDGTAMISWEGILTDEQIWQLVAFIRTLK